MTPKVSNFLDNGAVLPSGLLGVLSEHNMNAFKKTYQNSYLRVGVVVDSYDISSTSNISKLVPEYDVLVFEQNEDSGSNVVTYKNCVAAESFGSIADFFEAKLRKMKSKTSKGSTPSSSGQNGAIVLILCLNGLSEKGIIVGALKHPDRKTTLTDDGLHLEGCYNGLGIKVNNDGSASVTFNGTTDNDGNVIDKTQGTTTISIEKDGSYQIDNTKIVQRLDKNGDAILNADGNISNTAKKDFDAIASGNINLKATKNFFTQCQDLVTNASGSAMLECQKLIVNSQSEINLKGSQFKVVAEAMASIKASTIVLDGMVSLGGNGGQPVLILSTTMMGVDSKGVPVISQAISGFANKVLAQ
jgi:hypothetical protein